MFLAKDLPPTLALFPLPRALLLPRVRLPLHIFEPRYLAMLDDALKTPHRLIGMVQPDNAQDEALHAVGCAGRITSFNETDDGRYMISLRGISRFRITQQEDGFTPYLRASVHWDEFRSDLGSSEKDEALNRPDFLRTLGRYFEAKDLSTDWAAIRDAEDELLINSLAMLCPFDAKDKQALLEAPTLRERRETLQTLIEFSLLGGDNEEKLQ